MSYYFIKLYLDLLDDPKMGILPDWVWRRFIEFLLVAKENNRGGELQPVAELAWRIRQPEKVVSEALRALEEIGVVAAKPDNRWLIINFAKRQANIPPSERGKLFRKKERKTNETFGNTNETFGNTNVVEEEVEVEKEVEKEAEVEVKAENLPATAATENLSKSNLAELKKWGIGKNKTIDKLVQNPAITPKIIAANAERLINENRFTTGLLITALKCGDDPPSIPKLGTARDAAKYSDWET